MKKWFKFLSLSFFSHSISKESLKRGYTNVFFAFVLVLAFLWAGFVGGDMLPFGMHYKHSDDFRSTAYSVFLNDDEDKRIEFEIEKGALKAKKHGSEYTEALFVNTFENENDKQSYSVNGYNIVIDTRPADALAEVEAYCVSNDGNNTVISYEDYLTLSDIARLNFDFKLRYTGNELAFDEKAIENYKIYIDSLNDENSAKATNLSKRLQENEIDNYEYNKEIYKLYFTNYYPNITEYESTSEVPLLRNYYYHEYLSKGSEKYLFVFDDYMTGAFQTESGVDVTFYGFYSGLENGVIVSDNANVSDCHDEIDTFIKESYKATADLNMYAYAMNIFSLIPFVALMLLTVTLLAYSLSRLRGVDSIASFGSMLKIVGSFSWFCGFISAIFTVIAAFFVQQNIISALPLVIFFAALAVRSLVFTVKENQLHVIKSEQQAADTEV